MFPRMVPDIQASTRTNSAAVPARRAHHHRRHTLSQGELPERFGFRAGSSFSGSMNGRKGFISGPCTIAIAWKVGYR